MRALLLAVMLLPAAAIGADPVPPRLEPWEEEVVRRYERSRHEAAERMKKQLATIDARDRQVKRARLNSKLRKPVAPKGPADVWSFPHARYKQRALENLVEERAAIEGRMRDVDRFGLPTLMDEDMPFKVGTIGRFSDRLVNVRRVIDDDEMVIQTSFPSRGPWAETYQFLVRGVSTAGVIDGQGFEMPQTVRVLGTARPLGRTILVFEPIDLEAILKRARSRKLKEPAPK